MLAIVITAHPESEAELQKLDFTKKEVWMKDVSNYSEKSAMEEMATMQAPPYQFAVTSCWGMAID